MGRANVGLTELDAGKAAGSLRTDVDAHGVSLLIVYLSRLDRGWEGGQNPSRGVPCERLL
ncbi:hypothetical protein GCM10023086_60680 [Streptomyces venetus]|uniref:Resolvase/invertase-type recombinase catalytic domain-containing protein n=1 Tax=Streptomyces venetus TaxID=1701086 RepID=A0ABP8GW11_9ACTN